MPEPLVPPRRSLWIVAAAVGLYCLGFLVYFPRALIVADEIAYVGQAVEFARGRARVPVKDPLTGEMTHRVPMTGYPVGTSLLQVPFVWMGGWRAAPLASVLSLVVLVGILARWLQQAGKSPLYALLALGYLPMLVLGRSGMSDVPSGLAATIGLYLFFRGDPRSVRHGFVTGFVAGASTIVRESNALVFVPLFVGAVVRREKRVLGLVLGGLMGVVLRPLAAYLLFGEAPRVLRSHMGWTIEFFVRNAPLALFSLLVLIPAGLAAAVAYRGPRRPEIIATVLGVMAFFTSYEYGAFESGGVRRLVLAPRYFIPIVPLLVIAMADALPRWRQWLERRVAGSRSISTVAVRAWIVGVCVVAFAVHPAVNFYEKSQRDMVDAIHRITKADTLVITNLVATGKLLAPVYGGSPTLDNRLIEPGDLPRLLALHGSLQLVLLDRTDSDYFREEADDNRHFTDRIRSRCDLVLVYDHVHSESERLRIWNVTRCQSPTPIPI
jgi:hypothetical protein